MSGRISLLGALLALQLVIIAAVLFMESGAGGADQGPYLDFIADAVDTVEITGEENDALVLTRDGDGWRLPDGLPADRAKVDELLQRLQDVDAPWPVATSGSARERFEVTDENHQRHLVLRSDGEAVVDLYLGTSPGYQRSHARRAGDDAVYSVEVATFQVPAAAREWLDKALLQASGDVQAVTREGAWTLTRADDGWQLGGAGVEGEGPVAADAEAAERLARRFAELRVMGTAAEPAGDAAPPTRFQVTDADGEYTLSLWEHGENEPLTVRSSRREGHFELASYVANQLLQEGAALLPPEESAAAAEGNEAPDSDGAADDAGEVPAGREDGRG